MCMANALWARLDRVVFGATIADANRYCLQIHIAAKEVARRADMACVVEGPVLRELCNTLFTHPNMQKAFRSLEQRARRTCASHNSTTEPPLWTRVTSTALASLLGDDARVLTHPQVVRAAFARLLLVLAGAAQATRRQGGRPRGAAAERDGDSKRAALLPRSRIFR